MDLTKDPIPGLIRKLAIPAATGFLFNTMYNVVDTYWAGKFSEEALKSMGYTFPVFFILMALASGIGQGSTALIANYLGAGDKKSARLMSQQTIGFALFAGIVIMILGWLVCPFLFRQLKAEGEALKFGLQYMNWVLAGAPFFILQQSYNACLNAAGDTKSFRNLLIAGFFVNMVLDPWFMYGGLGIPAMGIRGIALSTTIIQIFGSVYLFYKLKNVEWRSGTNLNEMRPRMHYWKSLLEQGTPASLNMITVALGIFVITWFLSDYSDDAVAAYIAATRIEQIILVPTIGFNIAILTLTGQNNGAGRLDRVREAWKISSKYGLYTMLIGGGLLFVFRAHLMRIFTDNDIIIGHGVEYLLVASITLFAYVILFQTVFMLQGLKKPAYAFWIGLFRQLVAPISVFWFLGTHLGWKEKGVWWGVFIVTWSAALFTLWYGNRLLSKLENKKDVNKPQPNPS